MDILVVTLMLVDVAEMLNVTAWEDMPVTMVAWETAVAETPTDVDITVTDVLMTVDTAEQMT